MGSTDITKTLPVHGMHCASCASIITKRVQRLLGVRSVSVNIATETASVTFDPRKISPALMNAEIQPLGYAFIESQTNRESEMDSAEQAMQTTTPFSVLVFIVMLWDSAAKYISVVPPVPMPMNAFNGILAVIATYIIFQPGKDFLQAIERFIKFKTANMDTLIGIGSLTAYLYSLIRLLFPITMSGFGFDETVYFDAVIVVIGFVRLGKYLELRSKRKTGEALAALAKLQTKTAYVRKNGVDTETAIELIEIGNTVIVKPGSTIPLDGVVIFGESAVDESMMTGESLPIDVAKGSRVIGGTMNINGAIHIRVTKTVRESVLSSIVAMVSAAQGSKTKIEQTADRVAGVFVPIVLGIAVFTLVLWLFVGPMYLPLSRTIVIAVSAVVGILVIACPCALGLATPTAIIVAVGRAASMGILVKDAESLEKLYGVTAIVLDKTGTLTQGKPVVTDIVPLGSSYQSQIMKLLTSLEAQSEHPLARAVVSYAKEQGISPFPVTKFSAIGGRGVQGTMERTNYVVRNKTYMEESGVSLEKHSSDSYTLQGKTPLYLAKGKTLLGVVYVADSIKEHAKTSVEALMRLGISVVMATGDEENTARHIASLVGITTVEAHVDPQKKHALIKKLQSEGHTVAMVGDGINDAPALAAADVGIAMSTGTDVAIHTANLTLLHGDIAKLVSAISLSKKTMQIIQENLFWAFIYNIVGIPIAAGVLYPFFGILLHPAIAGIAMAGSSVSVVMNSLRLKRMCI